MLSFYGPGPDWSSAGWFNLGARAIKISLGRRVAFVWLWVCFNRRMADGTHHWGVGILQIGRRHLAYVGSHGASFLFLGQSQ